MIIYSPSRYYTPETEADRNQAFLPIVMRALRARGIVTEEDRKRFMFPDISVLRDPYDLPNMDKAVERIEKAVESGESICIYGDYDVDGICATTILLHYLLSIGAEVSYRIPSRKDEGYGISEKAIDALYEAGVTLIITVDNGISATKEIAYARDLGIDVIVTDHHIPPEDIPECTAVVCHTIAGDAYPNYLCGAGTALKLIQALGGVEAAKDYIFLAGVATVADVVPLLDENRFFVKYALEALNKGECCLGMRMLLDSLSSTKKPYSVYTISYGIAPKLNASGRMGDASLGVELFMTEDEEEAARIISQLSEMNEQRQAEEQSILNEAIKMVEELDVSDKHVIVLASDKWNPGVIGIAASRLAELYNRPTVLFSEYYDIYKGSSRSIEGINIHDALKANADLFLRFGGHAKAAGVSMEKSMFKKCADALEEYFANNCSPDLFVPRRCYEFDEDFGEITMELTRQLEMLSPFGEGNPCPVFHVSNVSPFHIKRFGCDGQHLRMDLRQGRSSFESVYFCGGSSFESIMRAESISLLYSPTVNNWNGSENLQMRIISVRPDLPRCTSRFLKSNMTWFYEAFLHGQTKTESGGTLPDVYPGKVSTLVKSTFAGLLVLVFSVECAENVMRELASENAENFEVYFGNVPEGVFAGNVVLLAPNMDRLPQKGFNRILFADEPYSAGAYDAVAKAFPGARIERTPNSSDFSDIIGGFSISRDEMGLYYKTVFRMINARNYSLPELVSELCEVLNRPKYQTEFAIRVFSELGFITDNGGKAVRIGNTERRCLSESPLYARVSNVQYGESS
ncbi:MAG: single-stranded-DNA-specific exonuclease RecJ [Clostridiales bacterium]|nr:single-stranded-DNA-specific exonuclease RecJ [Clostridiales bacterium]